ncbi:MAG: hypothetical protein AAGU21_21535 [Solidesulfovibrio sp.]|jgi:hypothetical protein|uniref:hypothetical protein n=1 Tax=Solidesulfovibrio sp. TaxID=2910990 RepID=UPI003158BAFD
MDAISGAGTGTLASAFEQQKLGAQVVTDTLTRLNTDQATGRVDQDFDFQTKVLSAATGLGGTLDVKA